MKFKVYFGENRDETDEFIQVFEDIDDADIFVSQYIRVRHSDIPYVVVHFESNTEWWYDFGDLLKYYTILGCDK